MLLIKRMVSLTASSIYYLTASVHLSIVFSMFITCDSTVLSHSVPQDDWTALGLASVKGHTDVVQLLLSSGAQVDLQSKVRRNTNLRAMSLCIADNTF